MYCQEKHIEGHIWKCILCHSACLLDVILSAAYTNYDKWIFTVLCQADEVATSGVARNFCMFLNSIILSEPSILIVSKVASGDKLFGAVKGNIDGDELHMTL